MPAGALVVGPGPAQEQRPAPWHREDRRVDGALPVVESLLLREAEGLAQPVTRGADVLVSRHGYDGRPALGRLLAHASPPSIVLMGLNLKAGRPAVLDGCCARAGLKRPPPVRPRLELCGARRGARWASRRPAA